MGASLKLTKDDVICCPLPLYHGFGMTIGNLTGLIYGCPVILPAKGFDAVATLESISRHKATVIYAVPTMYMPMIEEMSKNKSKYNISTLRIGLIGGSQ